MTESNKHAGENRQTSSHGDAKEVQDLAGPASEQRRKFIAGVGLGAGAIGAAALGVAAVTPSDAKSRILSRIQEQIQKDELADPNAYEKGSTFHEKYSKGS